MWSMMFFLRQLFKKVRNAVLHVFILGGKSTSWSQVTMKLLHKFLTELGFKYFISKWDRVIRRDWGTLRHMGRFHEDTRKLLSNTSVDSEYLDSAVPSRPQTHELEMFKGGASQSFLSELFCFLCLFYCLFCSVRRWSRHYPDGQTALFSIPFSVLHAKKHSFKGKHWKH